ncbi:hypothetical protein [Streptococcus sp. HMSC065C01]|uniref:hypothetical protein n=1 Tax=Streptococcus sp. HMSC065C01 TaxID=1739422 RepID=UPI0008A37736|nr:hypothetical protein [Streptococcus sp. HMSC065C01]OFQ79734.1 hypothetical protein HMPREF2918_06560 [Streptococcus sp. HMSC065C01]
MTKINITLDDQNELNEILNEVSKKAKELQEVITRLEQFEIKISVSPQQKQYRKVIGLEMDFEDKIIELSDWLIEQSETYREALIKLEKLTKDIAHEIILRAIEQKKNKE